MFSPEERQRAMDLYLTTPMTTAQVVEYLGHPTRQCLERWPAADSRYAGHVDRPIILMETRTKTIEPVPGGMRQKRAAELLGAGVGAVHNRVRAYREGGMAALRPENRDAGQADKPAMRRDRDAGDAEAPRRRIEEPELGNALMREVAEVAEKDPGAGLRRLSNREKTLPVDRLRPEYSPGSMACLSGIAPGSHLLPPRQARGRQIRRAQDGGGGGVRLFQGKVRVPQDQGHAQDRRLGEGAPQDHGRGRSDGARSQTTRVRLIRG